ncbi:MAG: ABC-F family ATP-binding cassette domain-containing protein [Bdellovibrionota bacterium]
MAVLVNGHDLSKGFSGRHLFDGLAFGIADGERIGLIGPNGAGKSTLLKMILGSEKPDSGNIARKQGLRVAYLSQTPELNPDATILETILEGALDPYDWESTARALEILSKLAFDEAGLGEDTLVASLSGGWRKKVALCRELMREPNLLLMDEPTNHLDVESILWLEEFLAKVPFATLTITHDRLFLNRISNCIWELDRRNPSGLLRVEGDYATFCEIKEQHVNALERKETVLKNTLRRETEWLRRGPAARTTKQTARINRAGDLLANVESLEGLNKVQSVGIVFGTAESTPKKLIEAKKISKAYGDRSLFKDFSLLLQRGNRIGLLGPNGAGKSTLIKLLLGVEQPDSGTVERSDQLQIAYFDQNRENLDPNLTVLKTICPQGDHVFFRGNYTHVRSYLDRFLFNVEQSDSPVSKLSGGEQARLLIAKLMLREANILVLDEPTNDLDLPTLNILEERLKDFEGAIVLVSHDRYFMDQVVDRIFVPADGQIEEFMGVGQWEAWQKERAKRSKSAPLPAGSQRTPEAPKKVKLSYNDQRELDQMETKIHGLEAKLDDLTQESAKTEVASNSSKLLKVTSEMATLQQQIDALYARWSELEAK